MKKLPFYGLTIVVVLVIGSIYVFGGFESPTQDDDLPPDLYGNLDLVVSGEITHTGSGPAGPTLSGHEGTTYWYNVTTLDWPEWLVLEEAPIFLTSDFAGTNLFLKVLREDIGPDGAIVDWQVGVELDDNITIEIDMDHPDAPPADEFPPSLTEITIPAGTTVTIPGTDWGFGNLTKLFEEDDVMRYLLDRGELSILQPLLDANAMDENNQTFHDVLEWIQSHRGYVVEDRIDLDSYYDWDSMAGVDRYEYDFVLENVTIASDGWVTTSVPFSHIDGVWLRSDYNWEEEPWNQDWERSRYVSEDRWPTEFRVGDSGAWLESAVVTYRVLDRLYVYDNEVQVTGPVDIVHGVWRHGEYDWDLDPENHTDQQARNIWNGTAPSPGGYTIGINTSLGIENYEHVVAVYNMSNPPTVDWNVDYDPLTSLNVSLNFTEYDGQRIRDQVNMTYSWDDTGLLQAMYLFIQGDFNDSGVIEANEYIEVALERLTRTNANEGLPGGAGYSGTYDLSNMNFDVNASESWLSLWSRMENPPVEEIVFDYESFSGTTLFDYTVSGVDGNWYALDGTLTNPQDSTEQLEIPPFLVFNAFDGSWAVNATQITERQDMLGRRGIKDMLDYQNSTLSIGRNYWHLGDDIILEHIVLGGETSLSTLIAASDVKGVWNASEYDWNVPAWEQPTGDGIMQNWIPPKQVNLDQPYSGDVLVAYHPARHMYAWDSQVFVERDIVPVNGVEGVYLESQYNWDLEPWEPQNVMNYYLAGSYAGNMISLGTAPPDGEHLVVVYKWEPLPGYKLYMDQDELDDKERNGDGPPKMQALGATQDDDPIAGPPGSDTSTGPDDDDDDGGPDELIRLFPIPLRTADWWATDNMVDPVNSIYTDEASGIMDFIETELNAQAAEEGTGIHSFVMDADLTVYANDGTFWVDSFFDITFEIDGDSSFGDPFPVNSRVSLNASLFIYRNYTSAGIFEDAGFNLEVHGAITALEDYDQPSWWTGEWWTTIPPSSEPPSSEPPSSEDSSEPTAVTPGFGIFAVLLTGAALILWQRKK
ncbi:MAG: hypothetical protein ACE5OZ_21685 [Candidatus Heimdallarchaeota archaeon]